MLSPTHFLYILHSRAGLTLSAVGMLIFGAAMAARANEAKDTSTDDPGVATAEAPAAEPQVRFNIRQIRVRGAKALPAAVVEKAVYPYLGAGRTLDDLEGARGALEKAYKDEGFQTVAVDIPQQNGTRGIIYLDAVENTVGRLRVHGAKYFSPEAIKRAVPSLAEGTLPDWEKVTKDIVAVNGWPDRKITPVLKPGVEPGTVDVDLNVEDNFPLHGSLELNNRYSPDTSELRLNASASYDNLWQAGHSLGLAMQVAPERTDDALVYSGYYIARFASAPEWSLMLTGTKQDSDVSTISGSAVAGRGQMAGLRLNRTLPGNNGFTHSLSGGFDWKQFDEDVTVGLETFTTPIEYYPFSLNYTAAWNGKSRFTALNAGMNFSFRGIGSDVSEFDAKRYEADGKFIYFRGDLSHTQDLPAGFQAYGKIQGQITPDPLINSEQYAGGGQSTVRGYLESEVLGDNGVVGTVELRSPSLLQKYVPEADKASPKHEWRFHGFVDAGKFSLNEPLPEQQDAFELGSVGLGTRLLLGGHWNGSVDVAWPLVDQVFTRKGEPFVSFRVWADF